MTGTPSGRGTYTREGRSPNGRFVLVYESRLRSDNAKLSLHERGARGLTLRWSIRYEHFRPHGVYIADSGRYVVIRETTSISGIDKVLVFLGPDGELTSSYDLKEILTEHEMATYTGEAHGYSWARNGLFFFRQRETQFAFVTQRGTVRVFDLASGQMLALTSELDRKVRREAVLLARKGLASRRRQTRASRAVLLGVLGDRRSVPALKRLLEDRCVTYWAGISDRPGRSYSMYGVQLAAGGALAAILGAKAAPLLEPMLPGPNVHMTEQWIDLLGTIRMARFSPVVRKLCRSRNEHIREAVIGTIAEEDDGTILRQHPRWARDGHGRFRLGVIKTLSKSPRSEDEALFRAALAGPDAAAACRALEGLMRLYAPDLDALLRDALYSHHDNVAATAIFHLAQRGDKPAMQRLLSYLKASEPPKPDRSLWAFGDAICRLIVEVRPRGGISALRAANTRGRRSFRRAAAPGALAALGDARALARLRRFAREGEAWERAQAIEWLGFCQDRASASFLRDRLSDPELNIREAAQNALRQMGR